jgi:hypothetical protein
MGTVSVRIKADCLLEEFMQQWEQYFFNSYFSHLIREKSPVKGNIIQLWQSLVNSGKQFSMKYLIKNGLTLKQLLSCSQGDSQSFSNYTITNYIYWIYDKYF